MTPDFDKEKNKYTRELQVGSSLMDVAENAQKSKSIINKTLGSVGEFILHNGLGISNDEEVAYYNQRHKDLTKITKNNMFLNSLPEKDKVMVVGQAPEYTFDYDRIEKKLKEDNPKIDDNTLATNILNAVNERAVFANIDKAREAGIDDLTIYNKLKEDRKKYTDYRIDEQVSHSDFVKGIVKTLGGIYNTELDVANLTGLINDEKYKQLTSDVLELGRSIEESADTSLISSYTAGTLFPTLVTMPTTVTAEALAGTGTILFKSLMSRALVYGGYGALDSYVNSRGTENVKDSKNNAIVGATLGATLGVIPIDKLASHIYHEVVAPLSGYIKGTNRIIDETSQKRAYAYFKDIFGYSEDEVNDLLTDYYKISKPSETIYADKTLAMVYAQGKRGAEAMRNANEFDVDLLFNMNRENRLSIIRDFAEQGKTPSQIADRLAGRIRMANKQYKDFTDKFIASYGNKRFTVNSTFKNGVVSDLDNLLDDAFYTFRTEAREIKDILSRDEITGGDLMTIYRNLNQMVRNTKNGNKLYKLGKFKDTVNKHLEKIMSANDYAKWLKINKDYRDIVGFSKNNNLGKNLSKLIKDSKGFREINDGKFYKMLANMDLGDKSYVELAKAIGDTSVISDLEKATVKAFLRGKELDDITYKALNKNLQTHEFITKEGKTLKEYIKVLNKNFNIDDKIKTMVQSPDKIDSSHSANAFLKAMSYLLSAFTKSATKLGLNPNKQSINALRLKRIMEINDDMVRVKKLDDFLQDIPQIEKDKLMENAIRRLATGVLNVEVISKIDDNLKSNTPALSDLPNNEEVEKNARIELVNDIIGKGNNISKDKVKKLIEKPNIPASKILGTKEFKSHSDTLRGLKNSLFIQDILLPHTISTDVGTVLKIQNKKVKKGIENQLKQSINDLITMGILDGYMVLDSGEMKTIKDIK